MEENRNPVIEQHVQDPPAKKEYEKPAVVFERPLEAMAAVCPPGGTVPGKAVQGVGGCTQAFS